MQKAEERIHTTLKRTWSNCQDQNLRKTSTISLSTNLTQYKNTSDTSVVLWYNQCVGPDAPQGSKAVKKTRQRPNFVTLFLEQTSFLHAEPDVRARQLICTTLLPFHKEHVMHQHLQKVTSNSKRQQIKMNSSQSVLGCVS